MERLDRAYASHGWLDEFPMASIQNFPIIQSDHTPIWLQTEPSISKPQRPYQIESWCLQHPEVVHIIKEIRHLNVVGSTMYSLGRKLEQLRKQLKTWCLDKRLFWGIKWRNIFNEMQHHSNNVSPFNQSMSMVTHHRTLMNETSLALTYWKQRIKEHHLQLGDIPSKFLFNRLRQKKHQNFVYMLCTAEGEWVDRPPLIAHMLQEYFKDIYRAGSDTSPTHALNGPDIDLVLRELHILCISHLEAQ